jgi:hypothetical protein
MKPYRPSGWKSEYEKHKFNRNDRRSWGRKGRKLSKVKGRRAERKKVNQINWEEWAPLARGDLVASIFEYLDPDLSRIISQGEYLYV